MPVLDLVGERRDVGALRVQILDRLDRRPARVEPLHAVAERDLGEAAARTT